ncbi:SDR family NAD(P)-dependent oxidoreductase [Sandarakinorhabdus sp.]|uniref:SDR family NAD(P)-dependent oxidoreductase n=1 Tax=Sandarakinorhabdus sp. TaxID=1916663 RepID=UPI00286E8CA9|nr:SDR family NAD(P)-dependent oxidoreductase [Sandarakinorhabdus sp.]
MTRLVSFAPGIHAVVVGASGGIGAGFVHLLRSDPAVASVTEWSRAAGLDLESPASIASAISGLTMSPDLVIVATGLLHGAGIAPEKSNAQLDAAAMARAFAVNTIGPALLARGLLPLMAKDRKTVFAALSARVGSISDNRLGGWHSYRASKAALNQLLRTMAIEQARRWPLQAVLALHPGTVDTGLSRPFQKGVPVLMNPAESAAHLLGVIDAVGPERSGQLIDWKGETIPY